MKKTYLLLLVSLCFAKFAIANNEINNVCKTFGDYYTNRDANPNCYYNPDIYLSIPQIIQRYGYCLEVHNVPTEDHYSLTLYRISNRQHNHRLEPKHPIFIQHGLGSSSMQFIYTGKKSLAFILSDAGYDVWLGNFRGSEPSNLHDSFNISEEQYWNFSFHENGVYDLPAQLNYILNETNEKVIYIGYSMGSTAYFIYNSEYSNMASKRIRIAISLAPVLYLHNLNPFQQSFVQHANTLRLTSTWVIDQRTAYSIAQRQKSCLPDPFKINNCLAKFYLITGFDCLQQDMETLPITAMQHWDAISTKSIIHYFQIAKSKRFQKFDYGEANVDVYGSPLPPLYNLSQINVPNYFMYGQKDLLANEKNVQESYSTLPIKAKPFELFLVKYGAFDHFNFITAKDVVELLYNPLLQFLKDNEHKYT